MTQRNSDARNTMLAMRRQEQLDRSGGGKYVDRWGRRSYPCRKDGSLISPAREALRMASKVKTNAAG